MTDVLNSVAGPKRWTTDDIVRAHRIGQSRDGQPKPMIVKFNRWKDKMTVLSNRQFRDNLENRQPGGMGRWPSSRKANLRWNHDGQTPGPTPKSQQQMTQGPQPTQPRSSQLIGSTLGVKRHVKTAAVTGIPRVSTTRAESVPFLHVQTVAVHRVTVDPGNPDCPTTGIADGHRHGVLATSVKAL